MFKLYNIKSHSEARAQQHPRSQSHKLKQMILIKNQNRLQVENTIQKRVIISKMNMVDLYSNINCNVTHNKTIVHVLDYSNGLGDFLRGSILLAQYAKYFNINFKMDVSRHSISKYLNIEQELLTTPKKVSCFYFNGNSDKGINLYSLIYQFLNSNEEKLYITTNLYYNMNLVSEDIKDYINFFLNFKHSYYDRVKEFFNLKTYNVLHIRCDDENFNTNFEDNYLFTEIIKLQLPDNTIIISNNENIKVKLHNLCGFYFINSKSYHTGKITHHKELEPTIIDYIILSKSSHTYCFSYYPHGSGFSEQCSVLNNIPYSVVYLPKKNYDSTNIKLLINRYTDLEKNHIIKPKHLDIVEHCRDYNNISFITLTNTGYIYYTLNCLVSLTNIDMKKKLKTYCIGEEGYSILNKNHYLCELINDSNKNVSIFNVFRTNAWSNITYYKFDIIYKNLLNFEYVCITDGDIVYENKQMFDYLLSNIEDNDLLIQSEGIYDIDLCSGFMFIKSNENTISLFNPTNINMYRNTQGWDDQIYINSIKDKLKLKKLPLHLFPTGKYYYEYNKQIKQPYLIHFNWVLGNKKKEIMSEYNKWYI